MAPKANLPHNYNPRDSSNYEKVKIRTYEFQAYASVRILENNSLNGLFRNLLNFPQYIVDAEVI